MSNHGVLRRKKRWDAVLAGFQAAAASRREAGTEAGVPPGGAIVPVLVVSIEHLLAGGELHRYLISAFFRLSTGKRGAGALTKRARNPSR